MAKYSIIGGHRDLRPCTTARPPPPCMTYCLQWRSGSHWTLRFSRRADDVAYTVKPYHCPSNRACATALRAHRQLIARLTATKY